MDMVMEKQTGFWLRTVLLLTVLNSAVAEDKTSYFMVGGNLDLRPAVSKQINSILWKHNGNLLAEWVKDQVPLTYYGGFNGRTKLDTNSGRLEINKMTEADIGQYRVEINNEIQSPDYSVKVIKEVPQPVVWVQPVTCSSAMDSCTLTCDRNTGGAEPVTYSWKEGDGDWKQSGKDLIITKTETAHVKTFTCQMKNPVSEKESEAEPNPFIQSISTDTVLRVLVIVAAVVFVLLIVIWGFLNRKRILNLFRHLRGGHIPVSTAENGQTAPRSKRKPPRNELQLTAP